MRAWRFTSGRGSPASAFRSGVVAILGKSRKAGRFFLFLCLFLLVILVPVLVLGAFLWLFLRLETVKKAGAFFQVGYSKLNQRRLARSSKEQTERAVARTALFVRVHAASRGAPARLS